MRHVDAPKQLLSTQHVSAQVFVVEPAQRPERQSELVVHALPPSLPPVAGGVRCARVAGTQYPPPVPPLKQMKPALHSLDVQQGVVQIGPVLDVMTVVRTVLDAQSRLLQSASTRHFAPRSNGGPAVASASVDVSGTSPSGVTSSSPASTGSTLASPVTQWPLGSHVMPEGHADGLVPEHWKSGTSPETMRLHPPPAAASIAADTSSPSTPRRAMRCAVRGVLRGVVRGVITETLRRAARRRRRASERTKA